MSQTPELRSLDQILSLADNGDYLPDLQERIEANNIEMRQFANDFSASAKAKITLTIDMKLDRFGQLELTVDDKIVGPKPPKHKAVAWMTGGGAITTHNPAQSRMEIRDADDGRRELRTAE
ncbi:hypothetical protein [Paracoccus saliphilus]|uniref:Uncharacterized protein n=3 Tax=Paracoccus TaxID=265 RepID=A0A422QVQ8_9RHOB|nr:hypothetical protein [Paracoccus saliphilus]RNF34066.1 hypothetical protein A7A09_014330 [Paracoccus methylarcula]WCR01658.1 hypothetical protein JHX88_12020 [Paracoccus saliphilus]SIS98210.1 hypothetical protein SAMN05421772_11110 [Paracoccus saliphilus]